MMIDDYKFPPDYLETEQTRIMNILHLHVKSKYFDEIASGEKSEEYRLFTKYWFVRLMFRRHYRGIIIYRGYPKKTKYSSSNRIGRIWRGLTIKDIIHPEFGDKTVTVFAIRVNG